MKKRKEILNEILDRLISIDEKLAAVIHQPVIDDGGVQLLNETLAEMTPPDPAEDNILDVSDISDSVWSR